MDRHWEIYALKYGDRNGRTRAESFLFDDHPADDHAIDYFVWLLVNGDQRILVDTGYDAEEARRRGRPILRDPVEALTALKVRAEDIETVIITHLHYDHAGGLDRYPAAQFHVQEDEMAYATGPCMCNPTLKMPFTVEHVVEMVRHVYSGRVVFHKGDAEIAPGVTVHRTGGHSKGLQVVRVETAIGPVCLASDATHFYENFQTGKIFPIVANIEEMAEGFRVIRRLADGDDARVIPGHDPLVTDRFPIVGSSGFVWRLDAPMIA
ncbi:MAG: N-acyl homoserine lactonase family protein [Pseudomonadota bacterium]